MKTLSHAFVVLIISFLITSCAYYPRLTDVPLINKKGDTRLEGGITVIPSAHATISYGLTDKIAVQASGSIGGNSTYGVQGAAGIFKNLQNRKVMELYGGFGYGYGEDYKDSNPGRIYGNYQVYFVQFNYGKINGKFKNMDYGFGIKTGYLHTNMTDRNYYEYHSDGGPYIAYKDGSLLIEPVLFLRFGGKKLKFQATAGGCYIFKFTNTGKRFPYMPFNIGLGVSYSL